MTDPAPRGAALLGALADEDAVTQAAFQAYTEARQRHLIHWQGCFARRAGRDCLSCDQWADEEWEAEQILLTAEARR